MSAVCECVQVCVQECVQVCTCFVEGDGTKGEKTETLSRNVVEFCLPSTLYIVLTTHRSLHSKAKQVHACTFKVKYTFMLHVWEYYCRQFLIFEGICRNWLTCMYTCSWKENLVCMIIVWFFQVFCIKNIEQYFIALCCCKLVEILDFMEVIGGFCVTVYGQSYIQGCFLISFIRVLKRYMYYRSFLWHI